MSAYDGFKGGFDLTAAMQSFRENPTKEGKKQFFRQLKGARLFVPYQGDAMNVAALHNSAGEILLPAFTSPYELTREHTPWDNIRVMTLDDLKHIIIDLPAEVSGVVLNPFGKALVLRRPQLAEIDRTQMVFRLFNKDDVNIFTRARTDRRQPINSVPQSKPSLRKHAWFLRVCRIRNKFSRNPIFILTLFCS